MTEGRETEPVDAESQRIFAEAQDAMASGDVDALAEILSRGVNAQVDKLMENIPRLHSMDPEMMEAALNRIEDKEMLADPELQESLRQMENGIFIPLFFKELSDFPNKKEAKSYVNEVLTGAWTEEGAKDWWDRPRHQLGGRTPADVWKEDPQRVFDLAQGGRDQTAT